MNENKYISRAMELQALAQAGLFYTRDIYDRERFERIRDISAEMLAEYTELPLERVKELFCGENGYQTPKIDTRAAVFRDGKILLVEENNGKWSLPGGWCDVLESVKSNTEKETREEAGLEVCARRIIAVQDRQKHNRPRYAYGICKIFVECELLGGEFRPNSETRGSGYFAQDELPPLAEEKNTAEQIEMCFKAHRSETWEALFD